MPKPSLKSIISAMGFEKKLIGLAAILMVISLFLPWYQDVDSFHTGDTFTGLTGPLYLVGFTFLLIASFSLLLLVTDYMDKKIPLFNIKSSRFFLTAGIFSFYLIILVNTVYFDRSFGVNITLKQSQFGMFIAFVAAALLTIGGYLATRERSTILRDFQNEANAAIAQMPATAEQRRPKENLRVAQPAKQPLPIQQNVFGSEKTDNVVVRDERGSGKENAHYQPFRTDL